MLKKAFFLVLVMMVLVNAACPPGCEQRGSYCDCLSNATSVVTNCTSDLNCEQGYVCYQGRCVLAGSIAGVHVSVPEYDIYSIILIFSLGVLTYLYINRLKK